MSMSTREVVTKYFEFVNSGKWDDYLSLFANDIVMDEQLMGHIEGIKTVRDGIEGLRTAKKFKNHPVEIVVEGDKAMVQWHIETLGPNDEPIEAKGVNHIDHYMWLSNLTEHLERLGEFKKALNYYENFLKTVRYSEREYERITAKLSALRMLTESKDTPTSNSNSKKSAVRRHE